jgi:ectoine hydroxylase-related dioxygenase (phytanoyl-CoA dioxygenase family)
MPGPTAHPLRPVTAGEVAAFGRDGVVHLPAILPAAWIDHLVDPVEATIADPAVTTDMTALRATVSGASLDPDNTGRFLSGVDHWLHDPAFASFATTSPLPAIAGVLMDADRIHLYEDSVLVKEPGTAEATALHQDLGYFHLAGDRICTTWVPLDPVDFETGAVAYLRGSHRSGLVHRPNWFVSDEPLPGSEGAPIPEVTDDDPRLVRFTVQPGDVVVHHAATLHCAGPNRSSSTRRRAVSVRYCGDGVHHLVRAGTPTKAHHPPHGEIRSGDPVVDHPGCPVVWERTIGSTR